MLTLLVCDSSAEARRSVRQLLAAHPEISISAEAATASEAIAAAVRLTPDVILVGARLPVLDGEEAVRRLREVLPTARIVALSAGGDTDAVEAMLAAGASAYYVEGAPLWELERAIAGASEPLVRLAQAVTRATAAAVLPQLLAREVAELSGAAFAATYLARGPGLTVAGATPEGLAEQLGEPPEVVRRALAGAQPADADAHELVELVRLTGVPLSEALAVPLLADGDALGVLLVAMAANVQLRADPELLAAAAELAAAAVWNQRRLAVTMAEARHDPLTGLPNRRALEEHLDELLAQEDPVSVVLLDLDDFKQVNDTHGHEAGDRTLREVGRVLLRTVRAEEEAFRLGGDEFALVVRGSPPAAARLAYRVRTALVEHARGEGLPTASAGVAGFPDHGERKADVVRLADEALYAAKRAGKNRTAVHGESPGEQLPAGVTGRSRGLRILVVDDDAGLRLLLRTTFEIIDIEVDEADGAAAAERKLAVGRPDVIVLDIAMPGLDGLSFCRRLKDAEATRDIGVVLLSGAEGGSEAAAREAGADAFLRKPFSPLELLAQVERLAGGLYEGPFRLTTEERPEEQLLLYAQDLRRLLELERSQRILIEGAYRETVTALANALESKDTGTSAHSQRVRRYATELASALEPRLLDDPSLEYGFLLHDIGKIGIPDRVLQKRGPLTGSERRLMQTHTVLGEQMLRSVALLHGEGLRVIRSHHEHWDGTGYPDRLCAADIPLGARVFAVADALDAMTNTRPYRPERAWENAVREIVAQAGAQFDPAVVDVFRACEPRLRRIHYERQAQV